MCPLPASHRPARRFILPLLAVVPLVVPLASHAGNQTLSATLTRDGQAVGTSSPRSRVRPIITPLPDSAPVVRASLAVLGTAETATLALPVDGAVGPVEAAELSHLLRCRRTHREHTMSPGVLVLLADVAQHWPDHAIEIVSGFRAPPFGVPHSKHFRGQAIDLRVHGVATSKVRDYVWREHHEVGVGFYAKANFVHMDARPGELDSAWTASDEGAPEDHDPPWARRARRKLPHTIQPRLLAGAAWPVGESEVMGPSRRALVTATVADLGFPLSQAR